MDMRYRRFGKTGLHLPMLTAGMMRAMHSWSNLELAEVSPANQDNLFRVVERALALGINHLETARAYGTSERQLGLILSRFPRSAFILQTKVAPSADPEEFTANVLDSLARLRVDRLDLLAIHGLNDYQSLWWTCRPNGCLAAARRLQNQGKIGAIGFSGHGPTDVLLEAVRSQEHGGFDYLNLHWYTIFQIHTPVLELARERDLGVMIISPSDKGGMLHSPPAQMRRLCQPLTPMQFNDLFCLNRPEIHSITIGAARPGDFDEHLAAVANLDTFHNQVPTIYQRWQEGMRRTTGQDQPDDHWGRFRPWQNTPGYINIPFILWLYNLGRGWDLWEFARSRYQQLGRDVRWVPGSNASQVNRYDWQAVATQAGMAANDLAELLRLAHQALTETDTP